MVAGGASAMRMPVPFRTMLVDAPRAHGPAITNHPRLEAAVVG